MGIRKSQDVWLAGGRRQLKWRVSSTTVFGAAFTANSRMMATRLSGRKKSLCRISHRGGLHFSSAAGSHGGGSFQRMRVVSHGGRVGVDVS